MSRLSLSIRIVFAMGVLFTQTYQCCLAQSPTVTGTPDNAVVLTKLSPPVYPIALTARIKGDIELLLDIRRDGSVESATVISGPPLLERVA